jgi:hypothetical protein
MAKSLGEINYEYLIETFGTIEGYEDFFTSDDGDEVLVIPERLRVYISAENKAGAVLAVPARTYSAVAEASAVVPTPRRTGALSLLISVFVTFGRTVVRLIRRNQI